MSRQHWGHGMRFKAIILASMAAIGAATAAEAAIVKSSVNKEGRIIVSITGEIVPGDSDQLRAIIKSANDAGKIVSSMRLNSVGGNLVEGATLADTVKFAKIATNVGQDATCASACFLIFAAGDRKFANYTARVGVHGASDKNGSESVQSGAATVSMARFAKELGVPPAIIGRMVVTPPSEMVWLSPTDLQSMGTTMVGKPSQLPEVAAGPASPPMQLSPDALGTLAPAPVPKAKPEPTWDDMIEKAVRLSAAQNGGKARSIRGCQPEFKVCFNAILMKSTDGTEMSLKVFRDMDDKIIIREMCTFNSSQDIRKCTDWDTGKTHRDMLDASNNWKQIADN